MSGRGSQEAPSLVLAGDLPARAGARVDAEDGSRLDRGHDQVAVRENGDVADVGAFGQDPRLPAGLEPAKAAADRAAAGEEQSPVAGDGDPVRVDAVDDDLCSSDRRIDPPDPPRVLGDEDVA